MKVQLNELNQDSKKDWTQRMFNITKRDKLVSQKIKPSYGENQSGDGQDI